jgi:hypothetical protein
VEDPSGKGHLSCTLYLSALSLSGQDKGGQVQGRWRGEGADRDTKPAKGTLAGHGGSELTVQISLRGISLDATVVACCGSEAV